MMILLEIVLFYALRTLEARYLYIHCFPRKTRRERPSRLPRTIWLRIIDFV